MRSSNSTATDLRSRSRNANFLVQAGLKNVFQVLLNDVMTTGVLDLLLRLEM